jgi:tRNA A-37 threonylcarbamoyl transferase component Bud32
LDKKLNTERIKAEVKNLNRARKMGVNTPYVIHVDFDKLQIYMQKVPFSMKVKDFIMG